MANLNFKKEAQNFVDAIFVEGKIRLIEASEEDKRILKELGIKFPNPDLALFEGVYLMADESNKNRHYLSIDTVKKAVNTIRMKPNNYFHKRGQPIGVYINGTLDTSTKAMRTVGVLWRSLFPERVAEIETLIKSNNCGQSFELTYEKSNVRKDNSIELFDVTFKGGAILPRDKAACRDTSADVLAKMQEENVVMGGLNIESNTDSVKSGGEKKMADKKKETKKAKENKETEKKVESKKIEDMTLKELQTWLSEDSISAEERNYVIDAIVQKKVDKILADKALYNERRATLTEFTDEELANINILQDDIFDRLSKDNQIKVLQKVAVDHEHRINDIKWLEHRIHQLQTDKQDKTGKVETGVEKKEEKKTDDKSTEKKESEKKAEKKEEKPADKSDKKAADKVGGKKDGKDNKENKAADTDDGGKGKKSDNKSSPSDTGNPNKDKGNIKGDDKKDKGTPKTEVKDDKKTDTKDKSADKKDGSDNKNTDGKDKGTEGKLLIHGMPKVVDESVKKQMTDAMNKKNRETNNVK